MTINIKYFSIVIILLLTAVLASAQDKVIRKLENGENQKIVVYGTSLSASEKGWPAMLEESLNESYSGKAEVINSAQAAMWSTWGVENLRKRVLEHKPDMVILEFAMNDAFLPYTTSVEAAKLNLEYMVRRIKELYPDCSIFIQVMNMPIAEHKIQRPNIGLYYEMYRKEAKRLKVKLIDHYEYWVPLLEKGETEFLEYVPDGIHPSPTAQKELILPHILKALGASNIGY